MSIRACAFTPNTIRAFLVGAALLLVFALGNPAFAAPSYQFVDVDPIFKMATQGDPVTGTFDISVNRTDNDCYLWFCDTGAFNPDTQQVETARITFLLLDMEFGKEDIAIIDLGDPSDPFQRATVDDSSRFLFVLYLENIEAQVDVLAQINTTGTLDWQVAAALGNNGVYVKAGALMASENAIPEPSAALLFCLGFGVVGTATRRRGMH